MFYKRIVILGLLAAGCFQGNGFSFSEILSKESLTQENLVQETGKEIEEIENETEEEEEAGKREEIENETEEEEEDEKREEPKDETEEDREDTTEEEKIEGWVQKEDTKYYYEDGKIVTGWRKLEGNWYYFHENGEMATGWEKLEGNWYYLKTSGEMATGWEKIEENWYYLDASGKMATGWEELEGSWYYLNASGEMATGWKKLEGNWYYLNASGKMATGWKKVEGNWYYLNASGKMATGWKKLEGKWYYLNASGEMATGWKKLEGNWYYLSASGVMLTDWQRVEGKWYYLDASGAMLKSTIVQGYVLDSNGEWMVDSKYIAFNGSPYYIRVNKKACVVTIYALDENGYYTVPLKSMICSPGNNTPIGTFNTKVKYRWRYLIGNVHGQYSTRIVRDILFHSVPYSTSNENDLRADYFNQMGKVASAGCVRLQVEDAKWIYENCPLNTIVQIYENDMPGPFGVPDYIKIPTTGIFSHWDPTDPHPDNPWKRLSDGWNYIEGKWYYCCQDGSIAVNTVIDGYTVGQDGVWIP